MNILYRIRVAFMIRQTTSVEFSMTLLICRIMSGGLAEQSNVIDLGDIILEVNNIPIHSAEDLSALVTYP